MNILVTGATGFIGTNLIRELRKCHNLYIIAHHESNSNMLGLPFIVMSDNIYTIADFIKIHQIEGIIHLASLYKADHSPEQIKDLIYSNVYFGTAVMEAASLAGTIKWFLNTGSIWQNYNSKKTEYNPANIYAATKQAFIDIAKYYTDVFKIRFCTLKLCDTYGPADTRRKIIQLFKEYSESRDILQMSPGEQKIDLLYITDVVAGFIQLVNLLSKGTELQNEYVLTSGTPIPLKELAKLFCNISGKELNIEWGGRPYRNREVMIPWRGNPLPGWNAKVDIRTGIRLFLNNDSSL